MEYKIGYLPRKSTPIYTKENPLIKIARIRASPKKTFFRKYEVMLDITEIDPQLYNAYLE